MRSCSISVVILLLATSLIGGCINQTMPMDPPPVAEEDRPSSSPAKATPIPRETLYQLLVAEFAGIRQDYARSLQIYHDQALATKDPTIVTRATRIAAFLEAPTLVELAQQWAQIEPDNPEPRALSAQYLLRTGRLLKALDDALYLASSGDPSALHALVSQAETLDADALQQLLARLEQHRDTQPDNAELAFVLSMAYRQSDDLSSAVHHARQTLGIDPYHEGGILLLAQLYHQQGESEQALTLLEQSLASQQANRRLRLQYARFLTEIDLERARDQISTLAGQYPDDLDLQYTLALVNLELNHSEAAQKLLEPLLDSRRHVNNAHYQLGRIAEDSGHSNIAVTHYQQVRGGPHLLPAIGRVTGILSHEQDITEARTFLGQMRDDRPDLGLPLYQFEAELLLEHGAASDAFQILTDALQEYTDDPQLLYARFVVAERMGDLERIESDLRTILEQDPDNSTALNALGYSLVVHSDRYDEAYDLVSRALEQEPDNPAILDSMGWIYYQLGDFEQAEHYLQRAFSYFADPEIAAHLGEVLWVTGRQTAARDIWRQGLDLSPQDPIIHETLERLGVDDF